MSKAKVEERFVLETKDQKGIKPKTSWEKMQRDYSPRVPRPSGYWRRLIGFITEDGTTLETKAQAKKYLRDHNKEERWSNNIYRAEVHRKHNHPLMSNYGLSVGQVIEVAITRHDREAIHDWRHLQYIKNDVLGEEVEAVELYPRESRLMDTANTYWLYAIPQSEFPFGQIYRAVLDEEESEKLGAKQRPFTEEENSYYVVKESSSERLAQIFAEKDDDILEIIHEAITITMNKKEF